MQAKLSACFIFFSIAALGCSSGSTPGSNQETVIDDGGLLQDEVVPDNYVDPNVPCDYSIKDQSQKVVDYALSQDISLPQENPYATGPAPNHPVCLVQKTKRQEQEKAILFERRILPILFVPSDMNIDAEGETAINTASDKIAQSLKRVQEYFRSELDKNGIGPYSFNFDRMTVVRGSKGRDAYWCEGTTNCGQEWLPARVVRDIESSGYPLFTDNRYQVVFVMGGGNVLSSYLRSDAGGTTAVVGDFLLNHLAEPCFVKKTEMGTMGCDMTVRSGDFVVAQMIGGLMGLLGEEGLMGDTAWQAAVSDLEPAPIAITDSQSVSVGSSRLMSAGVLNGGSIQIENYINDGNNVDEVGYVDDVKFGNDTILIVYHKSTGLKDEQPNGVCGDYFCDHSALWARLVFFNDSNGDGMFDPATDASLSDPMILSVPNPFMPINNTPGADYNPMPTPTSYANKVEYDASIAFDSSRGEYLVVWYRAFDIGDGTTANLQYRLMSRRIKPNLPTENPTVSNTQELLDNTQLNLSYQSVSLAYSPTENHFLLVWGENWIVVNSTGNPLYYAVLTTGADGLSQITTPVQLSTKAKWPHLAYANDLDPARRRFLVTWCEWNNWDNDIDGHFISPSGKLVSPDNQELTTATPFVISERIGLDKESFLSESAYDPTSHQWMVVFNNGWDIYNQLLSGDTGELLGNPKIIASGIHNDLTFRYDPSVAYSPSLGRFLVSFGDDDRNYFDGLGNVKAQYVQPNGVSFSSRLYLHQQYEALDKTIAAAHPTYDLTTVAWSGLSGVFIDLIQKDQNQYQETKLCGPNEAFSVFTRQGCTIKLTLPAGALDSGVCATLYADEASDIFPRYGSCSGQTPAVTFGLLENNITLKKPMQITFFNQGIDPNDAVKRMSVGLVCRDEKIGTVHFQPNQIIQDSTYGNGMNFHAQWFETCQIMSCADALAAYSQMQDMLAGDHNAQLKKACQKLEEADLIGIYKEHQLNYNNVFYLNSQAIGGQGLGSAFAVGYDQVWALGSRQYAPYTYGIATTSAIFPWIGLSYFSGLAVNPYDASVNGAFNGKNQYFIQFDFPFPQFPLASFSVKPFAMGTSLVSAATGTGGLQFGIGIGLGLDLGDFIIPTVAKSEPWVRGPESVMSYRYQSDNTLIKLVTGLGLSAPDVVSYQGNPSYLYYGDGANVYTKPPYNKTNIDFGFWTGLSILSSSMGMDPAAILSALLAVAFGAAQDDPFVLYKDLEMSNGNVSLQGANLDWVCDCPLNGCMISATFNGNFRNLNIEPGHMVLLGHNDPREFYHVRCQMEGNSLRAFLHGTLFDARGELVGPGNCSTAAIGAPSRYIQCCYRTAPTYCNYDECLSP